MIGCFDTKEENFNFLRQCIVSHGESVIAMNTGIFGSTSLFPVELESELVAAEAGESIEDLRKKADRGHAVDIMGKGAGKLVSGLFTEGKIKAVIGMGGGGGTYIALAAMEPLPIGFPKLCISTLASKDVTRQVGMKDILLMPSVVDVAGLNRISRLIMRNAAAAVSGMAKVNLKTDEKSLGTIAISMFGNTTACVNECTKLLEAKGYEVMAFHANGLGGNAMETLIREDCFVGILDITTTELADELCGGICSAGPGRLTAAVEMGIPQVVVPGCLDMVNFAHPDTVPEQYKERQLYSWAPDVTLMRTDVQENMELAKMIAQRLNQSTVPVTVLLPLKGLSQIDADGGIFHQPEINRVLFDTLKQHLKQHINVVEIDSNINEKNFSESAVHILLENMEIQNQMA
ncbi:Tm-1-like ATP-binding domain-containing protein [Aquiflexum sp.]|uniref:Tm-1-like ATP-binding domain-containing protein n=1 Tax=Aquiflexum sp. TaxID=1872584 RepID=UPI0035944104